MDGLLSGLRVVEAASFIAAPSAGLHLNQLGAEVIRIDPVGGGPDFGRWPLAADGRSLYWEGLNRGKRSVVLDLKSPEGRALAAAVVAAPGADAGLFVTNLPKGAGFDHAELSRARPDLISLRVAGWADGRSAIDYTVNSAVGVPLMTGPAELGDRPVNHVLPAWDIATGLFAALALVAAERRRRLTGEGAEIRLPLADVAMAFMGHLGMIAEVGVAGRDRERSGNDLYGTFGRDFATADGRRVQLVAVTKRQWGALVAALGLSDAVAELERGLGVDFAADEGARFTHRGRLFPLFERATAARRLAELEAAFEGTAVCWSPVNRLSEAMEDPRMIAEGNPLFDMVRGEDGAGYLAPGSAVHVEGAARIPAQPAPRLGAHTEEVLAELLGLSAAEIGRLADRGVVVCA